MYSGKNREGAVDCVELVLFEDAGARESHRELFSFSDEQYVPLSENIVTLLSDTVTDNLVRIHIAVQWENLLKAALWTSRTPLIHDVLMLLKKSGVREDELQPFRTSPVGDLFPWLYYGKRFEVLRRVCNAAKARIETNLGKKHLLAYCHLVSPDTNRIVASSL